MLDTVNSQSLLDSTAGERIDPPSPERLKGIIGRHEAEVTQRIAQRQLTELRWIEDAEQYHGNYDAKTMKRLGKRSRLFINYTAPTTDALAARIKDLLFPTDEKNWGIQATPVPEMAEQTEAIVADARQKAKEAEEAQAAPDAAIAAGRTPEEAAALKDKANELQSAADQAMEAAALATAKSEEAGKRAEAMEKEIDDQLTECGYQAVKRDQIDCALKYGTGVTKGPVSGDKVRRGWKADPATGEYKLVVSTGEQPAYRGVDLFNFFPNMNMSKIEDSDVYERHLMTEKMLRELQHLQGFDKDAIRRLLRAKPTMAAPSYLVQLRNIRGEVQASGDFFHVFEYNGQISSEDMYDLAAYMLNKDDMSLSLSAKEAIDMIGEIDPLQSLSVCFWFCQGELLKFSIYPYDSGETMYSVFNLRKDEASIFGYGMPSILRDPQAGLNGAVRALMDNAGKSSGPQVIYDKQNLEPDNGMYDLEPWKLWAAKNGIVKENPPFQLFHPESRQVDLTNIVSLMEHFIDVMSMLPQVLQGNPGDPGTNNVMQTAMGTAILHNSANISFRAIVKNYDDDVTVPDIRRAYDFNMQFSKKPEIKGDYQIDARGSSVLLVREMQAQNLMVIALQFGAHPIFGPMLKSKELLKKIFQAFMIPADQVMLSDEQIEAVMAQAAQQSEAAVAAKAAEELEQKRREFEEKKLQAQVAIANANKDATVLKAKMDYDRAMNIQAAQMNLTVKELETKLGVTEMTLASKERIFAGEVGIEQRNAEEARARGEEPDGSGGYVSGGT